jgi:hypothetical protein
VRLDRLAMLLPRMQMVTIPLNTAPFDACQSKKNGVQN